MQTDRFHTITAKYAKLRIAVVGDFCLDRYLEIDPSKREISIETGLPVHNVIHVRAQPGGAGTILNNLVALGIGEIYPVGFYGWDGEGFELRRALEAKAGVKLEYFLETSQRRTFTYCKPLLRHPDQPPEELNRLDSKNWTPTPVLLNNRLIAAMERVADQVDAMIVLDQVDLADTGVVTAALLQALGELIKQRPQLTVIADSRRGLGGFPPVCFKMNARELQALTGIHADAQLDLIREAATGLAAKQGHPVFVTLSERGILGAAPSGEAEHVPALPVRGPIDIVGAGDAVTANLAAAVASGATLREALEMTNAAASIVIHQLGTTGTASVAQIAAISLG